MMDTHSLEVSGTTAMNKPHDLRSFSPFARLSQIPNARNAAN